MRIVLLILSLTVTAVAQAAEFFGITPGATTRAQVELILGDARERLADVVDPWGVQANQPVYAYSPPAGAPDARQVVVEYFPATHAVARLDVELQAPLPAESLRGHFGQRLLEREREDKVSEEFFYPSLQSLVLSADGSDRAQRIGYLSPRYVADVFMARFNHLMGQQDRLEDLRNAADKATLVAPGYARGYNGQGLYQLQKKNPAAAMEHFTAATQAADSDAQIGRAHAWLGELHWTHKRDKAAAERHFRQALEKAPAQRMVHQLWGEYLLASGQKEPAVKAIQHAVDLAGGAYRSVAWAANFLYKHKAYREALPHFGALVKFGDEQAGKHLARNWFRYGYTLQSAKRYADSIPAFEKALAVDPSNAGAHQNIGWSHEQLGGPDKAIAAYEQGVRAFPDHVSLRRNLAQTLMGQGRYRDARVHLEHAARLKPEHVYVRSGLARLWAGLGDRARAYAWLEKAKAVGYKEEAWLLNTREFKALESNAWGAAGNS